MVDARHPSELRAIIEQERAHRLVVVEFFAPECPGCRALYPKFCQIAEQNPTVLFVKANCDDRGIDEFRASLNIPCMPFFVFYRGAGVQDMFSASLRPDKLQRLRATVATLSQGPAPATAMEISLVGADDECLIEEQANEVRRSFAYYLLCCFVLCYVILCDVMGIGSCR